MRSYPQGKDIGIIQMKHTPYGYDIVGSMAVINEEQAAAIAETSTGGSSGTTGAANLHYGDVSAECLKKMWTLTAPPER